MSVRPEHGASPRRGDELARLRRLGRTALASYGFRDARLRLLGDEQNTTFRVEAHGGPYLLRIARPCVHTPDTIGSEMSWLNALRRDTDLGVPEPIAAHDGALVVAAHDPGIPEPPHLCVLLHWLDGRFSGNTRLTPSRVTRVGALAGHLQRHAACWTPPRGFVRPRVDTLTGTGKVESKAHSAVTARLGDHPASDDAARCLRLVEELISTNASTLCRRALDIVWGSTAKLARDPTGFGLIHADLHSDNYLFHHGAARAIDFDDCGWGFHLYDLAVTLWDLQGQSRYHELRAALLAAYVQERRLPEDHAIHLEALIVLRRMQILSWVLESREHAALRDGWKGWADEELQAIASAVTAHGVSTVASAR
jgi:Ser/Thr protein kinase RdoA (MazF antagonist)